MQVRKAYPLAIALAALMASPLVLAQTDNTSATSQNATARQPMTPLNSDISIATFNHLDTNHDGRVSAAEARADSSFNDSFRKLDADSNGYVSNDELTAASGNSTGTASTTDTTGTSTTTTEGSTATTPPVTYGNASDSSYESNSSTDTTGTDTSSTSTSSDTSGTNATDNSTTTTTTKHKTKKHKSP